MQAESAAASAGPEQEKAACAAFLVPRLPLAAGRGPTPGGPHPRVFYRPAPGAARRPRSSSSPTAMTSAYSARYQATATPCATTAA